MSKTGCGRKMFITSSVVYPEWFFSDLDTDLTFQLVSDPTWIVSYILIINFTFVFPFVSVLGCILWQDISFLGKFFLQKGIYFFKFCIFVEKLSNLISFFSEKFDIKFILDPELSGSGMFFSGPGMIFSGSGIFFSGPGMIFSGSGSWTEHFPLQFSVL